MKKEYIQYQNALLINEATEAKNDIAKLREEYQTRNMVSKDDLQDFKQSFMREMVSFFNLDRGDKEIKEQFLAKYKVN